MSNDSQIAPQKITYHSKSKVLEVIFDSGVFMLPCEYLRVFSPSAEVQGHGPGQQVLQTGKEGVSIVSIEPVGQYAVRLIFSDAHNSGLFSWDVLYSLGKNIKHNWQDYVRRLEQAGVFRQAQAYDDYLL